MNIVAIGIGIGLIACGVSGFVFFTVPAIYDVGAGVETIIDGEPPEGTVGNTILSGILAYVSIPFFLILIVIGAILTFKIGVKK